MRPPTSFVGDPAGIGRESTGNQLRKVNDQHLDHRHSARPRNRPAPSDSRDGDNTRRARSRSPASQVSRENKRPRYDYDDRARNRHDDRPRDRYDDRSRDNYDRRRDDYNNRSRSQYNDRSQDHYRNRNARPPYRDRGYYDNRDRSHGYGQNRYGDQRARGNDQHDGSRRNEAQDQRQRDMNNYPEGKEQDRRERREVPKQTHHGDAAASTRGSAVDKASAIKPQPVKSIRFELPPEEGTGAEVETIEMPDAEVHVQEPQLTKEEEDALIELKRRQRQELIARVMSNSPALTASTATGPSLNAGTPSTMAASSPAAQTPSALAEPSPDAAADSSTPAVTPFAAFEDSPATNSVSVTHPTMEVDQDQQPISKPSPAAAVDVYGTPRSQHEAELPEAEDDDDFDLFAEPKESAPAKTIKHVSNGQKHRIATVERSNKEGYFVAVSGELIANRYEVESALTAGKGSFAVVVKALDRVTNIPVALKIIRDTKSTDWKAEGEVIQKLNDADVNGISHIIKCFGTMKHREFEGLVFELMEDNLHNLLKGKGYMKNRLPTCRSYARQLFMGLKFLKQQKLIHKDIKPMNVLIRKTTNEPEIKICDFGTVFSADERQPESERHLNHGTPFYRPPEVFLGWALSYPYDMWTVGCTLFEVYTGKHFVQGNNNTDLLEAIISSVGISQSVIRRSPREFRDLFFDNKFNLIQEQYNPISMRQETKLVQTHPVPLRNQDILSRLLPTAREKGDVTMDKDFNLFVDLLKKCLLPDPDKRITPEQALQHPFFTDTTQASMSGGSKTSGK